MGLVAITVKVNTNGPETVRNLLPVVCSNMGELSAERIAQMAKQLVKRDTESLAESIEIAPDPVIPGGWLVGAGDTEGGYRGKIGGKAAGSPIDYAVAQEYAGVGKPYMTPAAEGEFPVFIQACETALRTLMRYMG